MKPILKQRLYAILVIIGMGFLLYRTVAMTAAGSLMILTWWAGMFLILEMAIDAACVITSLSWLSSGNRSRAIRPLRLCAAGIIVHAIRVLIFVLGRCGPWINFDVRTGQRAAHAERWTWPEVYAAGILSLASLIGLYMAWRFIRRRK
jgi:hypothetical protein